MTTMHTMAPKAPIAVLAARHSYWACCQPLWPALMVLTALCLAAATAAAQAAKVTPLMTQELAGIDGKEGALLMVEYAPGGSDAEHRHNAYAFVYVLEGALVMQVKGGKEVTLRQGQTFYESREDVHTVSRNASTTKPAKFLVFFVKQKGAPIVVPAK
jgi:quercetin dioxygenase-like cupin family protein